MSLFDTTPLAATNLSHAPLAERMRPRTLDEFVGQPQVRASLLTAFVVGRLQRFARSGFKRAPSEHLDACLARML